MRDDEVTDKIEIRESTPDDWKSIEVLYPDAFPDEDLLPVVRDLFQEVPSILSLAAVTGSSLVGHVIFTQCRVEGSRDNAALLAPLAVASAWQKKGIGTALIQAGFERLGNSGVTRIYVLGDPNYYGRFGFRTETHVTPPYPMPAEWRDAWQSIDLAGDGQPAQGKLCLPQAWLQPELWTS